MEGEGELCWESVGEKIVRRRTSVGVFRQGLEGIGRTELGEKARDRERIC